MPPGDGTTWLVIADSQPLKDYMRAWNRTSAKVSPRRNMRRECTVCMGVASVVTLFNTVTPSGMQCCCKANMKPATERAWKRMCAIIDRLRYCSFLFLYGLIWMRCSFCRCSWSVLVGYCDRFPPQAFCNSHGREGALDGGGRVASVLYVPLLPYAPLGVLKVLVCVQPGIPCPLFVLEVQRRFRRVL